MLQPIESIANSTIDYIAEKSKVNQEIDFRPIMQGFTLDSISKVAFGINTNCRLGEDEAYLKTAKKLIEDTVVVQSYPMAILWTVLFHFPELLNKAGIWPEAAIKIRKMTKDVMKERDERNIRVGDFVDRLRDYRKVASYPITEQMIEAQGMIFVLAGFDTTANTLGSMIYQVAAHQEVQDKILEEILDKIGSEDITHENIASLEYLEACIMENLRLCPPALEHDRTCVKDCVVNGIKVRKGVRIQMPIYSAHYNKEFFPEPEKYQPERFLKENADNIIPYTWRPFGSGNRVCIGQRFAMMEIKILIAKLISKFELICTEKSGIKPEKGTFSFFLYPHSFAKVELRN